MWDAATTALGSFLDPSTFLFLFLGVLAGLIVGVIPGLGGTAAVAILLPFIFVLEPTQAMALLIGAVAVVHSSDTIASVLIGIPGSASASVLLLDGHEMAKQGKAARALSIAFLSSMLGGVLGAIGLTVAIPLARPMVLAFGSPEIFMLTVLGISLTALLSKGNLLKGVLAGTFGVLLGQIGAAPASPDYRYTFGSLFLTEGLDLVAVALGIFGIAEVIALVARRTAVSSVAALGSGWREGISDVMRHWTHVLRGGLIGIWAGVLPGVGATAGTWMAYGQAQATAKGKDRKKFGKGDPRGIIAPESANNAVEAGDLIPTLLFGIPGGAPAALLLGALLIYGIEPGPRMITNHLDVIYVIIWSFAFASVIGSILCFLMAKPLSKLAFVRFPLLAAGLIPILFMSGFQDSQQLEIFPVMLALGLLGWLMKTFNIPRAPFLIGFVLSIPLERYYYLTANLYEPAEWLLRPGVLIMLAILIAPLVYAGVRALRSAPAEDGGLEGEEALNVEPISNRWRLVVSIAFVIVFAVALILAQSFSDAARLLPNIASSLGVVLSIAAVAADVRQLRREGPLDGAELSAWNNQLRIAGLSTLWLVLFIALTYGVGLVACVAIYIPLFLWKVANARWRTIVLYTMAVIGVLLLMREFLGVVLPFGYINLGV